MYIRKKGNIFLVQSSQKGRYYTVSLEKSDCTCPHFKYRLKSKGDCKHIKAVKELHKINAKDDFEKAVDYVKDKDKVEKEHFVEMFSEGLLSELIERGEIKEIKDKVQKNN